MSAERLLPAAPLVTRAGRKCPTHSPPLHPHGLPTVFPPLCAHKTLHAPAASGHGRAAPLRYDYAVCWLRRTNQDAQGRPELGGGWRRRAGSPATQVWTGSVCTQSRGRGEGLEKVPGAWHVASSSTLLRAGQGRWAPWPRPHPGHLRSPLRTHFYRTCGCGGARRCARRGPQTRNPTSSVSLCPLCPQRLTPMGSSLGSARGRDGREVGRVEARQSLLSGSLRGGCRRAEGSGSCEASSRLLWH